MKKYTRFYKGIVMLLLLAASVCTQAQQLQLSPTAQPAQGGHTQVGNFALDYTVGEPAQTTLKNGNLVLTQGEEQPGMQVIPEGWTCGMFNDPSRATTTICAGCSTSFISITHPGAAGNNDFASDVDDDRYLPNGNTNTKQIAVNFIFFRDGLGNNGFPNNSETVKFVTDVEASLNARYRGWNDESTSASSDCLKDGHGKDSKISFVVHKYYYEDAYYWDNHNAWCSHSPLYSCPYEPTWYINTFDNWLITQSNYIKGINVYFTEWKDAWDVYASTQNIVSNLCDVACSQPSDCDLSKRLRLHMPNQYIGYAKDKFLYPLSPSTIGGGYFDPSETSWHSTNKYWEHVLWLSWGLAHELGHCLYNDNHHFSDCQNNIMNPNNVDAVSPWNRDYLRIPDIEEIHQTTSMFSLRQYLVGCPYSSNDPYVVAADELIDYDFAPWRDIIVEPGATLTITCTVRMPDGGKIIVKPGAKLYVNGGTITSACEGMWDGIIVQGNKTNVQDLTTTNNATAMSTYQGFVYLDNATIENAIVALRVRKADDEWVSGDINSTQGGTGGIVRAVNSTFKNNAYSAGFMWYHYYAPIPGHPEYFNLSYFKNCHFVTDNDHRSDYAFKAHVAMWGVSGVQFTDCDFRNNDTRTTDPHLLGDGIRSIDASYVVKGGVTTAYTGFSSYKETFKNLYNGVLVENGSGTASVDVYDAGFVDNVRGVIMSGSNNSHINGNIFTVGQMPHGITGANINCIGVAFDNSSQFEHTLNKFNSDNGIDEGAIGSGFFNTGEAHNECFANDYVNMKWANLANLINRSNDGTQGLLFKCNTNNNTTDQSDFTVYQDFVTADDGVLDHQLVLGDIPPANTFSTGSTTDPNQFNNLSQNTVFYHWHTIPEIPTSIVGVIIPSNSTANDATCPTNNTGNGGTGCIFCSYSPTDIEQMKEDFDDDFAAYETYKGTLDGLIDGGNTAQYKMRVDSATSTNRDSVKNELLAVSPYVSATVLKALLKKYSVFADSVIFKVMYANPDALGNNKFMDDIEKIIGATLTDSLRNHRSDTTARTNLQAQVSEYSSAYHSLSRNIITSIQQDTAGFNHILYREWLGKLHEAEADYTRVEDYFETGSTDSSLALLDSIPVWYSLTARQDTAYNTFKDYMLFKKGLRDDSISISHLDSARVEELNDIALNGKGIAARKAQGVLHFFYGYDYKTQLQIPGGGLSAKRDEDETNVPEPKTLQAVIKSSYLKVHPNPANQQVIFEYNLPCADEDALLIVADMSGRTKLNTLVYSNNKQKNINTEQWQEGVYLYRLTCGNTVVGTGKIVILR